MTTLWLDHRDLELRHEGGSIVPFVSGQRQRPVPLRLLERVVVVGNCQFTASLLGLLAEHGVAVAIVSPRLSARRAWLLGPAHNDVTLRLAQLRAMDDATFRQQQAHALVLAKVRHQQELVEEMRAARPDAGLPLKKAHDIITGIRTTLEAADAAGIGHDALRGLEGSASRAQFQALGAVLPPSLGFAGRCRRPPTDPVNALLSLSYTLLHHRAAQVAWAYGLDPLLGVFHEPVHGRESLAADLIEVWRPQVDRWIWRLVARRVLRTEHFGGWKKPDDQKPAEAQEKPCLLGKAGRRIFYERYDKGLRHLHRALRLQVRALVRHIRAHVVAGEAER